jgi:hypothetical protein
VLISLGFAVGIMRAYREGMASVNNQQEGHTMTAKELAAILGKVGKYSIHGVVFPVVIMDARKVYGRLDYQVMPLNGSGLAWFAADRITL